MSYDIDHLLTLIASKKERESKLRQALKEKEDRKVIEDIDFDENGEVLSKDAEVSTNQALWVEKYTSHKFFDLLTCEVTNRNVLTWLKTWDEIVFPLNPKVNFKLPE